MKRFLLNIAASFLALYLAILLVPGVTIKGDFQQKIKVIFLAAIFLGIINLFVKPVIEIVAFPLKLITLGLFGLVINMAMVWLTDVFFEELNIQGLGALFWTTILVWLTSGLMAKFAKRKK
ncbi:phage holin family protein [bacterium]|nr:phage holin family protein [bacterium]